MQLDSVHIGVADLAAAAEEYERLLGVPAQQAGVVCRLQLGRGAVVLEPGEPGLRAVRFLASEGTEIANWPTGAEAFHGIEVRADIAADPVPAADSTPGGVEGIDHIVVQTADLDRAIALWRDRLGVRLSLDAQFPERGLRMCFFRSGGITLEFVSSLMPPGEPAGPDCFYGVAYKVGDLDAWRAHLTDAGLDVSSTHRGQKQGTRVATVRSGTAGVPTLLIEDSAPVTSAPVRQ